jgi:hypothetical protein
MTFPFRREGAALLIIFSPRIFSTTPMLRWRPFPSARLPPRASRRHSSVQWRCWFTAYLEVGVHMRHLFVWVVEFIKFLGGRRLHPLLTQCPICRQTVRLHVNRAGRRHVVTHARSLYEGCRLCVHFVARVKCLGSGTVMTFDPPRTNINDSSYPIPCLKSKRQTAAWDRNHDLQ